MRLGNLFSCFSFLAEAGPWATMCAGKSSNAIRTCDRYGCGHYGARRYGVSQITISSLGSSPLCLVSLPCVSSSAHEHLPLTAGKLRDETSCITAFGAISKNSALSIGSELGRRQELKKREKLPT